MVMSRVAPAARARVLIEAISGLQRLRREFARTSQKNRSYQSQRRVLGETIRRLQKAVRHINP